MPRPEHLGQQGPLGPEHAPDAGSQRNRDHDDDGGDIATAQHPPDGKSNQQLKDRERAVHDHPPVAVGQDPRQRHDQGTKGRGKHEAKGSDRTFEPHNADDVTDCQGLIDRRSAVFTHAKADAQEQRLPRAFQQVGQRSVIDLVASLQLGELGRLLQTQPDPDRDGDDDDAEQERQAPQPRLGDVIDPQQQDEIDEGCRNGAELDAHEGQRREEAAPVARRIFGHQHGRPGLLRSGAEPLQQAQEDQHGGRPIPDARIGREDADQRAGRPHQEDGGQEDKLATQSVAQDAEHDPAHRTDREADEVRAEAGQQSNGRVLGRKEQRSEDEGRREAVQREIVVLERAAEGTRPTRPVQVLGGDFHLVGGLPACGQRLV